MTSVLDRWRSMLQTHDPSVLQDLVADEAVFHSPVVHTPQRGKAIVVKYLAAADHVLNNGSFRYLREWVGPQSAVLEFSADIDGIAINGVDMIEWNAAGKIVDFKVMVRPLKAIGALQQAMAARLMAG
ncbi:MAG: nuclear transport factor 2 family protein [Hyphomicrobiales bacterium]|nr:nuclear transport factor 2 family protein [Hyphomicrobiales bacterium]